MELIAYLIGLVVSEIISLPGPVLGGAVALGLAALIYRQGWRDAVNADYAEDIAKADARRRARWR